MCECVLVNAASCIKLGAYPCGHGPQRNIRAVRRSHGWASTLWYMCTERERGEEKRTEKEDDKTICLAPQVERVREQRCGRCCG